MLLLSRALLYCPFIRIFNKAMSCTFSFIFTFTCQGDVRCSTKEIGDRKKYESPFDIARLFVTVDNKKRLSNFLFPIWFFFHSFVDSLLICRPRLRNRAFSILFFRILSMSSLSILSFSQYLLRQSDIIRV